MIIKINDKNGNNIAQCILQQDEYGNWFQKESNNCKHIYVDTEQTKYGFEDALDIDINTLTNTNAVGVNMEDIEEIISKIDDIFNQNDIKHYIEYDNTYIHIDIYD